jgi:hypothetical protein
MCVYAHSTYIHTLLCRESESPFVNSCQGYCLPVYSKVPIELRAYVCMYGCWDDRGSHSREPGKKLSIDSRGNNNHGRIFLFLFYLRRQDGLSLSVPVFIEG